MKRLEDAGAMIFMNDEHRAHLNAFETESVNESFSGDGPQDESKAKLPAKAQPTCEEERIKSY
jgi:hypothetical protein